jgi:hypothetical protein
MEKISSQQAQTILKTASATIRTLQSEKADLQEKVAGFEKRERAEKIAAEMEEKGLHADLDRQEKVAHLLNADAVPNLDVTEEAVKMASPQNAVLGNLGDRPGGASSGGAFEHFIVTGEAPEE